MLPSSWCTIMAMLSPSKNQIISLNGNKMPLNKQSNWSFNIVLVVDSNAVCLIIQKTIQAKQSQTRYAIIELICVWIMMWNIVCICYIPDGKKQGSDDNGPIMDHLEHPPIWRSQAFTWKHFSEVPYMQRQTWTALRIALKTCRFLFR